MIDAKQYAYICASYGDYEPSYLVRFCDLAVGAFQFGPEEAEDVRRYPGVLDVVRLKPGRRPVEWDADALQFNTR